MLYWEVHVIHSAHKAGCLYADNKEDPIAIPKNKILQRCNQSIAHNFHCYSSNIKKRNISWTKEKWLYRHIRHSHHYYFARELSSPTLIIAFFQLIKKLLDEIFLLFILITVTITVTTGFRIWNTINHNIQVVIFT